MTGRFTFCDSTTASAGVIGPNSASGPSGAALAGTAATACPAIRAVVPATAASRESRLPRLPSARPLLPAVGAFPAPDPGLRQAISSRIDLALPTKGAADCDRDWNWAPLRHWPIMNPNPTAKDGPVANVRAQDNRHYWNL
jgi:hypothetical protein